MTHRFFSMVSARTMFVAVLMMTVAAAARAQFSGPALGVPAQANGVQTPTTDPAILLANARDTEIGAGDSIAVRIFGTGDFVAPFTVGIDGTVQLPLIGSIKVGGMSINRAEDLIAERLANGVFYINPQVTITILTAASQFASVGGEVHAIVPIAGERRLLDVLASAGNFPLTASRVITIVRPGVEQPIVVDLGNDPTRSAAGNIRILPGDSILVSRVGVVYMLGAFKVQGAIPLQQNSPLTLMQATALAQGAGYEGKFEDLRIVRTVGLERKEVRVNIKNVLMGKAPDPVLQADDIVFLPSNALKAAIKAGGLNTVASIASILLLFYQINK